MLHKIVFIVNSLIHYYIKILKYSKGIKYTTKLFYYKFHTLEFVHIVCHIFLNFQVFKYMNICIIYS